MQVCPCQQFDAQKYKGVPYQDTPCSKCFLTRNSYTTNKHDQLYDQDGAQSKGPVIQQPIDIRGVVGRKVTDQVLGIIVQACEHNFLLTLSNTVLKLVDMAKTYPVLFQILVYKMQHPQMSYYDIGSHLNPPCSKQNVLYHLSHAVRVFPQLQKAIFTDTRFSGGRYALKKVADAAQRTNQVERVRKLIYDQNSTNRQRTIAQLKQQLSKPFKPSVIETFDTTETEC